MPTSQAVVSARSVIIRGKVTRSTTLPDVSRSVSSSGIADVTPDGQTLAVWYPDADGATLPPGLDETEGEDPIRGVVREVVHSTIDLDRPPGDPADAYLRLHLLSQRSVRPHEVNVDGIFSVLANVAWTNIGPCAAADFAAVLARAARAGIHIGVHGVDKFPRMTDYVVPSGVRIADANRVRLGAYLGEGTTVMHEGFINFNAGTLGASMVEGRISAGVLVGDGSDIGGGASIMGTLSGGGTEVISIGEGCLLGANSGVGISLGDNSVVEAGLYVTAGTIVTLPDGTHAKGRELSGVSDMLFRRNSVSGTVEAIPRSGSWGGLNTELHAN